MAGRRIEVLCAGALLLLVVGVTVSGMVARPDHPAAAAGHRGGAVVQVALEPPAAHPIRVRGSLSATVGGAVRRTPPTAGRDPAAVSAAVLGAYRLAVQVAPTSCHLPITLLLAIGQVESANLAGHGIDERHRAAPAVIGPVLDGSHGYAAVPDTDGGRLDGDRRWDRAVGPMQFIPSTWRLAGVDMDVDGVRDPQDIEDAAGAAMVYLCANGRDLATAAGLRTAILSYNHSAAYLALVLAWKHAYDAAGVPAVGLVPAVLPLALRTGEPLDIRARPRTTTGTHARPAPVTPSGTASPAPASPAPASAPPASAPPASSTPTPDGAVAAPADACPDVPTTVQPTGAPSPIGAQTGAPTDEQAGEPPASPPASPTALPTPPASPTALPTPTDSASPTPTATADPSGTPPPSESAAPDACSSPGTP
jgi:hypothetical protein